MPEPPPIPVRASNACVTPWLRCRPNSIPGAPPQPAAVHVHGPLPLNGPLSERQGPGADPDHLHKQPAHHLPAVTSSGAARMAPATMAAVLRAEGEAQQQQQQAQEKEQQQQLVHAWKVLAPLAAAHAGDEDGVAGPDGALNSSSGRNLMLPGRVSLRSVCGCLRRVVGRCTGHPHLPM